MHTNSSPRRHLPRCHRSLPSTAAPAHRYLVTLPRLSPSVTASATACLATLPGRLPHANALRAAWKSISLRRARSHRLTNCGSPRSSTRFGCDLKISQRLLSIVATRDSRLARYLMRREARGVTDASLWRPQNVSSFSLTAFCTYKREK